jgi:hypothetical protein
MKYLILFEMFQIIDKELEREFHDVEDYFLDLFDASNQKWNIRINRHFENSISVLITKDGESHADDAQTTLVKRNPLDTIASDCMDRLSASKDLRLKFKKKRWRYGDFIGYACVLMGYNEMSDDIQSE